MLLQMINQLNNYHYSLSIFFSYRDRYNIATKKDKILSVLMIVMAVFSNAVAIYSDASALINKKET